MTEPSRPAAPADDRRDDPPPPTAAEVDGNGAATEAEREVSETVRSISRLEESN